MIKPVFDFSIRTEPFFRNNVPCGAKLMFNMKKQTTVNTASRAMHPRGRFLDWSCIW